MQCDRKRLCWKYISSFGTKTISHVYSYNCWLKGNIKVSNVTSFKIIENGDFEIILIEDFPCKSKKELLSRGRYWCNKLDCVNKVKNQGIKLELGIVEYQKLYRDEHKVENRQHMKQYHKHYREKNKEILSESKRMYYIENKTRINASRRSTYICECGGCYSYNNKCHHIKSKSHEHYLNLQNVK